MSLNPTELSFENDTHAGHIILGVTNLREQQSRIIVTYSALVNDLQIRIRQLEEQNAILAPHMTDLGREGLLHEVADVTADNAGLGIRMQDLEEVVQALGESGREEEREHCEARERTW